MTSRLRLLDAALAAQRRAGIFRPRTIRYWDEGFRAAIHYASGRKLAYCIDLGYLTAFTLPLHVATRAAEVPTKRHGRLLASWLEKRAKAEQNRRDIDGNKTPTKLSYSKINACCKALRGVA